MVARLTVGRCLQSIAQYEIDRTPEKLLGLTGHLKYFLGRNSDRIFKGRQKIDIAMGSLITPRE